MCLIVKAAFHLRKGSFFVWKRCSGNLKIIETSRVLIKKSKYGG